MKHTNIAGRFRFSFLLIWITAGGILAAGPGVKLAHDAVAKVTTGSTTEHTNLAPKIYIKHGCKPFSAVDDAGNYNGGLKDSGAHDGGCSSSPSAITYARSVCKDDFCGHMFVYYFPKDNGYPFPSLGHRHDFEEVVVWTEYGDIIGAAYSAHGDYYYDENPRMSDGRVNAVYQVDGVTHSFGRISSSDHGSGTTYAAASFQNLTANAKAALNDTSNFTTSVFAARDDNFLDKINEARIESVLAAGIDFKLPAEITASGSIGGNGGSEFNDAEYIPDNPNVTEVGLRTGRRVDQVNIRYSEGTYLSHGGGGGGSRNLILNNGEYITSVYACKGRKSGGDRVFYMRVTTNQGRTVSGGRTTSSCTTFTAPAGKKIVGWHGRSGSEVDRIGALFSDL